LFQVETQPGQMQPDALDAHDMMLHPIVLGRQQGLQGFPVLALLRGGMQQGHHLIGILVERRVAQHQVNALGVGAHQVLNERIKALAGLAGRIEKLDDLHPSRWVALGRGVIAHQAGAILLDQAFCLPGLLGAVIKRAAEKSQQQDRTRGDE
jgi:hypothetical protein